MNATGIITQPEHDMNNTTAMITNTPSTRCDVLTVPHLTHKAAVSIDDVLSLTLRAQTINRLDMEEAMEENTLEVDVCRGDTVCTTILQALHPEWHPGPCFPEGICFETNFSSSIATIGGVELSLEQSWEANGVEDEAVVTAVVHYRREVHQKVCVDCGVREELEGSARFLKNRYGHAICHSCASCYEDYFYGPSCRHKDAAKIPEPYRYDNGSLYLQCAQCGFHPSWCRCRIWQEEPVPASDIPGVGSA